MKTMRLFSSVLVILAIIFLAGCPDPINNGGGDGIQTIEITGLAVSPVGPINLVLDSTQQITATVTPANANTESAWASSNTAVATVSDTGLVTAVGLGFADISITSVEDPAIKAEVRVNVVGSIDELPGFAILNQSKLGGTEADVGNTSEVPGLVSGKIEVVNNHIAQGESTLNESDGIAGYTILYYTEPVTGNFEIEARIKGVNNTTGTARGVALGAFGIPASVDGEFGDKDTPVATMFQRSGGTEVRSFWTKDTGGKNGAGDPEINPSIDEYIYRVTRNETGYVFGVYNSQSGELIKQNSVSNESTLNEAGTVVAGLVESLRHGNPVYLGFAAGGASMEISNIKIYSDGVLIVSTPEVAGSFVGVKGVTVSGPELNSDAEFDYQTSLAIAQADDIVLTATVTPAEANIKTVTWTSSNPAVATVSSLTEATAQVNVVGAGETTITVETDDEGFIAEYKMNITAETVLVTGITVSGDQTVLVGNTIDLDVAVLPADATNQGISWLSSLPGVATVNENGVVTGVSVGTTTITATAQDGSGILGTLEITVEEVGTEISWTFADLHSNWPEQDPVTASNPSIGHTSDVNIGSGLMINLFDDGDERGARTMRWRDASIQSSPGEGYSAGALQTGGGGWFGYVSNLQGPFTVTIKFSGTGGSHTPSRFAGVSVTGPSTAPENLILAGTGTSGSADLQTFVYNYSGTDIVTLDLYSDNGIRVYDIIIQM